MAFELRVYAELSNLAPESEEGFSLTSEHAGVVIRADMSSTLVTDADGSIADVFVIAGAKFSSISDEVLTDVKGQLEIAAMNARKAEGES